MALIQTAKEWDSLSLRVNDLCQRGLPAEMVDESGLRQMEPHLKPGMIGAALALEGHLNVFRLYQGLAQAAHRLGAEWLTHSPVTGFSMQSEKVASISTTKGTFSAPLVILACGAWTGCLLTKIGFNLPIQFTQAEAIITEPLPPVIFHHVGMADFYHAVHGSNRKVAFGVGQHANGMLFVSNAIQPLPNNEEGLRLARRSSAWAIPVLANALHSLFPVLDSTRIVRAWSAPSPFLPDYLPVVGWVNENLYVAAGFHLAIPTIAALSRLIAAEIVSGQPNVELSSFRPQRWQ